MKKIILFCLIISLIGSSCEKFLDTKPTDFVVPGEFYKNEQQLMAALSAVYATFTNGPNNNPGLSNYSMFKTIFADGINDEGFCPFTFNSSTQFSNNQYDYTNPDINAYWQVLYAGINQANNMLASKSQISNKIDTATVNALMAEAQFLRGFYYFLLVQHFGDVPLRLEPTVLPTEINTPASPAKDVYAQIIKDMTNAEPKLYPSNSARIQGTSRVSQSVASGIIARVYLFMAGAKPVGLGDRSQYENALLWSQKVVNSGVHGLLTNKDTVANVANLRGTPLAYPATNGNPEYKNNGYAQVFVNEARGIYKPLETMWEVSFGASNNLRMGYLGSQIGITCNDQLLGTVVNYRQTQNYLYNLYSPGDLRRDWNIAPYSNGSGSIASRAFFPGTPGTSIQILNRPVGKWRREYEPITLWNPKQRWNTTISFPLLRYSDVLLMFAEAEFQVNGSSSVALDAINQVRRRAFGTDPNVPNTSIDLTTLTLEDIQAERARELAFEALRTQDLKRWGIYLQRLQEIINFNNAQGFPTGSRFSANLGAVNAIAGGTKFLLWPKPSSEMLVNKAIVQNPGW